MFCVFVKPTIKEQAITTEGLAYVFMVTIVLELYSIHMYFIAWETGLQKA